MIKIQEPNSKNMNPDIPFLRNKLGKLYRPCVGIMLVNSNGDILVGKRIDIRTNYWQMPQGGINDGESVISALWREMKEEIGTNDAQIISRSKNWLTYEFPKDLIPKLWKGRYIGQAQMWYLLKFTGGDNSIILDQHDAEFSEVKWEHPSKILDKVITFKQEVYKSLLIEFEQYLEILRNK